MFIPGVCTYGVHRSRKTTIKQNLFLDKKGFEYIQEELELSSLSPVVRRPCFLLLCRLFFSLHNFNVVS